MSVNNEVRTRRIAMGKEEFNMKMSLLSGTQEKGAKFSREMLHLGYVALLSGNMGIKKRNRLREHFKEQDEKTNSGQERRDKLSEILQRREIEIGQNT